MSKRGRAPKEEEDIPFMARDLEFESRKYVFNLNGYIANRKKKNVLRLEKAVQDLHTLAFGEGIAIEKAKNIAKQLEKRTV